MSACRIGGLDVGKYKTYTVHVSTENTLTQKKWNPLFNFNSGLVGQLSKKLDLTKP